MGENLEIKCRYPNHRLAARKARDQLHANYFGKIIQTDTYFNVPTGRLKLRHDLRRLSIDGPPEENYELIHYHRPNRRAPKTCSYRRLPLAESTALMEFLTAALGVKVTVKKARKVYLYENTRIHLDTVDALGKFLEFELIMSQKHPLEFCRWRLEVLLGFFGIEAKDLLSHSYSDMLLEGG